MNEIKVPLNKIHCFLQKLYNILFIYLYIDIIIYTIYMLINIFCFLYEVAQKEKKKSI